MEMWRSAGTGASRQHKKIQDIRLDLTLVDQAAQQWAIVHFSVL